MSAARTARHSVVHGAHHDVLNDVQHRSVAAEVVAFLETLRNKPVPDGLAWFDTSIERTVPAGDHLIVLLRLHAVSHVEHSLPLVFHRSGFGLNRS